MKYTYTEPIEMPRGTHYGSDYWIAYSSKAQRKMKFYSMLEYINFLELEMNPTVEYFCEQPLKIVVGDNNKSSVFDFWVYYLNGMSEFQEIKYSKELEGTDEKAQRSQLQISLQKNWCDLNNYSYKVVTEDDLFKGEFYVSNIKILQHKICRYNTPNERIYYNLVENYLSKSSVCNIYELKQAKILPFGNEMEILASMYQKGLINMNLSNQPLDNNMEVWLCENENIT